MSKFFRSVARHWLLSTLFVLTLMTTYTKTSLYGADPTPTPNVSTVPNPSLFFTPTPTPTPVIVIITREAPIVETPDAPPDTSGGSEQENPVVPADAAPTVPNNGNGPVNSAPGSASVGASALTLSVVTTPTLVWQGVVFRLHFVISNPGTTSLTHLALRQTLPPALHYVTSTIDNAGSIAIEAHPNGGALLAIDWPHLAQNTQTTATVTLQVDLTTPNGLLLDSRAVVQSSEGATTATDLTLAMPPAELPQFRK